VIDAYREIEEVAAGLSEVRGELDVGFTAWFREADDLAVSVGEAIVMPRTAGRQTLQANHPAHTPEEYFRRSVAAPFLDYLLSEFGSRFKNSELVHDGLTLVADRAAAVVDGWQTPEGVKGLALLWAQDLPDPNDVPTEFHRWCLKWHEAQRKGQAIPTTLISSLQACNENFFPNISRLLRLLATLPVTTAECERSISGLRRLKTYLRSTMSSDRLNGLALMHFHQDVAVDVDAVVTAFAAKFRTRMATMLPQALLQC
jgi:hypothetical protein